MKLFELTGKLGFKVLCHGDNPDGEIQGGYTSDLLSDVMGNAEQGMIWLTLQTHRNVVAVASLKEVAAVLLTGGAIPGEEMLEAARQAGVTVLSTALSAFEASGRIYELIK